MYLGDRKAFYPIDFTFTSRCPTGSPYTLAGSPAVAVYRANSTTKIWDTITLTVDFNSITGLNQVRLNPSGQANYPVGNDFSVVLVSGSVSGISVAGETLAWFGLVNHNQTPTDAVAVSGTPTVNVTQLAGDSTSATNIKNQYDGSTGLTGNTFPARQSQLNAGVSVSGVSSAAATQIWQATTRSLTNPVSVSGIDPATAGVIASSGWANPTRTLTAGTNITLAKGTGITGFNDLSALDVSGAAYSGVTTYGPLQPTVAGRKLDVTTGGEAGIDWNNIGTPTATVNLSGTTVATITNSVSASGTVNAALSQPVSISGVSAAAAEYISASGWSYPTRLLTAGTNIVLTKGVGVTGFNDITAADVWSSTTRSLTNAVAVSGNVSTSGTVNATLANAVTVSGVTPAALEQIANSGWSNPTRILTAGTNISLAKGTGVTGFNDIAASDVWSTTPRGLTLPVATSGTVAVSGLNDITAAQVWTSPTRSLTNAVAVSGNVSTSGTVNVGPVTVSGIMPIPLADISGQTTLGVWNYVNRTLTSAGAGGATAQEVWEYSTRSLTNPVSITGVSPATLELIAQSGWSYGTRTLTSSSSGPVTVSGVTPAAAEYIAASGWNYSSRTLTDKTGFGLSSASIQEISGANAFGAWNYGTRILTGGNNIVLAKGVGVTGFNDIAAADVWTATPRTLTGPVAVTGSVASITNPVAVSGLNDLSALQVWTYTTRGLNQAVAVSGLNDLSASQVWSHGTRTLTGAVAVSGSIPSVQNPVAVSGTVSADVVSISGSTQAAYILSKQCLTVQVGEVRSSGGNNDTTFLTNLTGQLTDHYGGDDGGNVLVWTSNAANKYQARRVSNSTVSGILTVESPFETVPSGSDTFVLLGRIEV